MSDSLVTTEFDADTGIATMTFNRPAALNAISVPMAEAFLAEAQGASGLHEAYLQIFLAHAEYDTFIELMAEQAEKQSS